MHTQVIFYFWIEFKKETFKTPKPETSGEVQGTSDDAFRPLLGCFSFPKPLLVSKPHPHNN